MWPTPTVLGSECVNCVGQAHEATHVSKMTRSYRNLRSHGMSFRRFTFVLLSVRKSEDFDGGVYMATVKLRFCVGSLLTFQAVPAFVCLLVFMFQSHTRLRLCSVDLE